jgi:hypothetical protein
MILIVLIIIDRITQLGESLNTDKIKIQENTIKRDFNEERLPAIDAMKKVIIRKLVQNNFVALKNLTLHSDHPTIIIIKEFALIVVKKDIFQKNALWSFLKLAKDNKILLL